MQLTLKPVDLLAAVRDYVQKNITVAEGKQIDVTFKAGRNGNGTTAFVDIIDANSSASLEVTETSDEAPVETRSITEQPEEREDTAQIDLEEAIEEAEDTNAMETAHEAEETPPADTGPVSIFGDKS